tara:strand:+ start:169 stop:1443 length:1275 start_codon:yes stop_codon:yes gene_type:complete
MSDDQTLMDAMPANREFVLPEERKMYRGFQMPAGMSTEQEMRYKSAIDERENFRSKAARQLPRKVEDFKEDYIKGPVRRAKEVGKEMFKEAEVLPGMAKAAGEFATDAALTVPRAKVAMYSDPEGSKEFMSAVASGDREAVRKFATGASESMTEPFATGGDAILALDALERGDSVEAGMYGAAVLAPYVSLGMLKKVRMGGEMAAESLSKPAREAADQLNTLEADLAAGRISKAEAKVKGAEIEEQYLANELADAIDADDFNKSSAIIGDKYLDESADYISPRDMGTLEEFLGRQGKDVSKVSKQGLLDIRNSKAFQDFELEDVRLSNEFAEAIDAEDFNKSSAMLRGGRPPSGGSVGGFKADQAARQKYYLLDPRTDKPIRTKSGKLKEFNSPDEADEYADEVLDDITLGIRDLDGNIPDGWR